MGAGIYFPLFVNLDKKQILIFGGGKIASRRISSLLDFGADIRVVSPECSDEILEFFNRKLLIYEKRYYREDEMKEPYIVIAATNDLTVNHQIYCECKKKGILVNVASDQTKSDFYFPGLAIEKPFVIGVTASGENHKKAKKITEKIREMLRVETQREHRGKK